MASVASNSSNSLSRWRPAILVLIGLTAGLGIYYAHSASQAPKSPHLSRSNAVRRRSSRRSERQGTASRRGSTTLQTREGQLQRIREIMEEAETAVRAETTVHNQQVAIPLAIPLISPAQLATQLDISADDARLLHQTLERTLLDRIMSSSIRELGPHVDWWGEEGHIFRDELISAGFTSDEVIEGWSRWRMRSADSGLSETESNEDDETSIDAQSEYSWRGGEPPTSSEGGEAHVLMSLLYHIAEDQARREGYVHRGVTCNSCGMFPIRGVRYRCANCLDFDLCENCEAIQNVQIHPRTHLFYKVRVPAPFLGNPRQAQPVWYPGKPSMLNQTIPQSTLKRFSKDTGFDFSEIEALWDQFRCLAATTWAEDMNKLGMALDRRTFDKCFVPNTAIRPPPPNLIYDRMFAFYDTDGNGLIGFEEFLKGLACLNNKNKEERLKRIFKGYDLDSDGYVDRTDFLRMFRAFYALSKELTRDIVAGMEDEVMDGQAARDIIMGSQPVSAAFAGAIPLGDRSRPVQGKEMDSAGDLQVSDDKPAVLENGDDSGDRLTAIADAAEHKSHQHEEPSFVRESWLEPGIEPGPMTLVLANRYRERDGDSDSNSEDDDDDDDDDDDEDEDVDDHPTEPFEWPPAFVTEDDVKQAIGIEKQLVDITEEEERVKIASFAIKRLKKEREKKGAEVRKKAVQERWRRRQFYLEEEEGLIPPEGVDEEAVLSPVSDGEEKLRSSNGITGSSSSHPQSPRSRSSSKVRFRDELEDADFDARSNYSSSSRNIPFNERWGGYEVPEVEKDVGKEIIYQVTQQGLNELLDELFKTIEDDAIEAMATRQARRKRKAERERRAADEETDIDGKGKKKDLGVQYDRHIHSRSGSLSPMRKIQFSLSSAPPPKRLREESASDSHSPQPNEIDSGRLHQPPVSHHANAWLSDDSLAALEAFDLDSPLLPPPPIFDPEAPDIPMPRSPLSPVGSPSLAGERRSRSMSPRTPSPSSHRQLDENVARLENEREKLLKQQEEALRNQESLLKERDEILKTRDERFDYLDMLEEQKQKRGGWGRLDFDEFKAIMTADGGPGKKLAFVGSWIEMASF